MSELRKSLSLSLKELDAVATGRSNFSLATAQVLVVQTATLIRAVVGRLRSRCAEHLARASAAEASSNTFPKFIHEVEAELMHAQQH